MCEYNPKRMKEYTPSSRGEKMAHTNFLTKRARQFNAAERATKNPDDAKIILEYLHDVFGSIDDVWFEFLKNPSKSINLSSIETKVRAWWKDQPITSKFDNWIGSKNYPAAGGYVGMYPVLDAVRKMADNKAKQEYKDSGKKEDDYRTWEDSVDKILNDDGNPSLDAFLKDWVEDVTDSTYEMYTNPGNINKWTSLAEEYKKKREDLWSTISELRYTLKLHPENKLNFDKANIEYRVADSQYEDLTKNLKNSAKVIKAGKDNLHKYFEEQAKQIKIDFVTKVCTLTGPLTSGVFYWGAGGRLDGSVASDKGDYRITSFFAGGPVQRLHVRTRITKLKN